MRVTQSLEQSQFIAAIDQLQSTISQNENQVSSGLAFTAPSQDPTAAGEVINLDQALSQSQQYTSNANSAQTSLQTENTALTQLQNQLQSLSSLALEANSGTESSQNLGAIAAQITQIQSSLLGLANTQDGNGNYIFAGYATQTQPFALTASGASYAGDQGQPQIQVAAGQTVAIGDNGSAVFNEIKTGNGTFTVTAAGGNTGTGVVGASTVADPSAVTGTDYTIKFSNPTSYQVLDPNNAVVAAGTYTSGQTIAFGGLQVTLSGAPAAGDAFAVAPSTNQSIFTTVQNLVTALQAGTGTPALQAQLSNAVNVALGNIDQAITHTSTIEAGVGGRLNAVTTQLSVASSQQTQLQKSVSSLQGLDYASAITTLDSENTQLSAAMQAYTLTQGLSLFKYIG
jgi:flagellar hook-associated protein 3 FlgL